MAPNEQGLIRYKTVNNRLCKGPLLSESLLIKTQSMLFLGFEFQETRDNCTPQSVFRLYTSLMVNWISKINQTVQAFKSKGAWNISEFNFTLIILLIFKLLKENVITSTKSTPDKITLHQK